MKNIKWRVGDILSFYWELEKDSREENGRHERRRMWFKQSGFEKKEKKKALRGWLEFQRNQSSEKSESMGRSWGRFYSVFVTLFFLWGLIAAGIATWAVLIVSHSMGIYFFAALFFLVVLPLLFTLVGFVFFFLRPNPKSCFDTVVFKLFGLWGKLLTLLGKTPFGLLEGESHYLSPSELFEGGAFQRLIKQVFQYRAVGFNLGIWVFVFVVASAVNLKFKTESTLWPALRSFADNYTDDELSRFLLSAIALCILARLVLLLFVMYDNRYHLFHFRDKKSKVLWEEMTTSCFSSTGKEPPVEEPIQIEGTSYISHSSGVVILAPNYRRDLTKERLRELCFGGEEINEVLYVSQDDEEDVEVLRSLPERVSIDGVLFIVFEGFRPCTEGVVMYVKAIRRILPLGVPIKVGLVNDEQASQSISVAMFEYWRSRIPLGDGWNVQVIQCDEENAHE